ncbi:hypothetical protein [Prauserella rugosa]|uniref:Uncharacterized protein n=1 Tax=Prauserella rugosa TaxID=43354 RepID=A0A660CGD7_9PSEU|nr:hypothetical protein [Prauserella rugosa]KMS90398.1 hypothetical protein ACZ91_15225 [Streptomyces regensis]TWH20071.1 hypothetical protein JD82_01911 [Prauserella rugosa]
MLYIVLILVLGALGLVVAALITAESLWAWISLGVSVVAGILLLIDWWRRRRALRAADSAEDTADASDTEASDRADRAGDAEEADEAVGTASSKAGRAVEDTEDAEDIEDTEDIEDADSEDEEIDPAASTALLASSGELDDPDAEPAEERAAAEDVRIVSVLEDEVVVVDERPRYHLTDCTWLQTRETIPLPVREARELGFSPCGRCWPDATLARRSRERAEA